MIVYRVFNERTGKYLKAGGAWTRMGKAWTGSGAFKNACHNWWNNHMFGYGESWSRTSSALPDPVSWLDYMSDHIKPDIPDMHVHVLEDFKAPVRIPFKIWMLDLMQKYCSDRLTSYNKDQYKNCLKLVNKELDIDNG